MAAAREIYAGLRRLSAATAATAASPPPFLIADYLVRSCGLSESKAKAAAASSSLAARISSPSNPDAVLLFLRSRGLAGDDVAALVARKPLLLAADVGANLSPKLDLLEALGFAPRDAANLLATAKLLHLRIDRGMKRRLDFVRSLVGGDDGDVVKVVRRSSWVLGGPGIRRRISHNLSKLEDWGIHGEKARSLFVTYPRFFSYPSTSIDAAAARAEAELGFVPRHGTMFFYLVLALLSQSESSIQSKFAVFEGFGWERSEAVALLRTFPMGFCLSDGKLREGLEFLMNRVGCTASEIVSKSSLLGMSLEKRLLPRYELMSALKSKNLIRSTLSFRQAAYLTEKNFVEKYVIKFMQQEHDACAAYLSRSNKKW